VRRFFHPENSPPDISDINWRELMRLAKPPICHADLYARLVAVPLTGTRAQRLRARFEANGGARWNLALSGELFKLAIC